MDSTLVDAFCFRSERKHLQWISGKVAVVVLHHTERVQWEKIGEICETKGKKTQRLGEKGERIVRLDLDFLQSYCVIGTGSRQNRWAGSGLPLPVVWAKSTSHKRNERFDSRPTGGSTLRPQRKCRSDYFYGYQWYSRHSIGDYRSPPPAALACPVILHSNLGKKALAFSEIYCKLTASWLIRVKYSLVVEMKRDMWIGAKKVIVAK